MGGKSGGKGVARFEIDHRSGSGKAKPPLGMSEESAKQLEAEIEKRQKVPRENIEEAHDDDFDPSASPTMIRDGDQLRSPTTKMVEKLKEQNPDQLYLYARGWLKVGLPVLIMLTIALFIWSNMSIGASVVFNLSIPKEAESAIVFTSNIPFAAGEVLNEESLQNSSSIGQRSDVWVPQSRIGLICLFTSDPMTCLSSSIVESMSRAVSSVANEAGSPGTREGESVEFDIFDFSLTSSVEHMWDGGAYALALLIAILSGAWPYIKLVCMLILWFVPIRPLKRGYCLSTLEALGKWSLIDVYVFALMMAGFRFVLDVGAIARIKIAIEAKWGIFSFCIGVLISHFLSHVMMFIHTNAQQKLLSYDFNLKAVTLSSVARIRHRKLSVMSQTLIAFSILVALGFTIACTILHTFKFTFHGIVGMLLPVDQQVKMFSLLEAGVMIPSILDTISIAGRIGEWFVVVVYYAFAFVTPILRMLFTLILWSVPLTVGQKQAMQTLTNLMGTWSALDVFVVSVIACIAEIGRLTSSIMGDACDSLKEQLGIDCLRLEASFLTGSWVMVFAVISSFIIARIVLSSSTAHFRRLAMLHLLHLKKKYLTESGRYVPGNLDCDEDTPKLIAEYMNHLEQRTISSRFANFLAGSVHEKHLNDSSMDFVN